MRRLLLLTYYFPPSGGAGVQRPLKWVKYLRDFSVEPTVLTVEAGAYPKLDASLEADVPPGVVVHRTHALDPFAAYARLTGRTRDEAVAARTGDFRGGSLRERLALWVRANLFVPDARVGWAPFAIREGLRLLRTQPFDAILTTGPPHSVHLAGRALHARIGMPWIADFRDPWTDLYYQAELPRLGPVQQADRALERSVLRRATMVTTVSPSLARLLAQKVDRAPADFRVIYNGFDEEDFAGIEPAPPADRFVLTYVGTLYGHQEALWAALARLREDGGVPRLRVRLVGRVLPGTEAVLERFGVRDVVETVPYLPHPEAVREMASATLLLLTIEDWPHAEAIVTGKLYEYLAAGRPVLGIGPPGGDAAAILRQTGAGRMFAREDVAGIAAHLGALYEAWERGGRLDGASPEAAARFSRRAQTEALARLVHDLAETQRPR